MSKDLDLVAKGEINITLPRAPVSFLSPFLKEMKQLLSKEPMLLELDGSFVIVGDLHGHFLDLCRIFKTFQHPNDFKYLFLGDLVDRGEFSFETIFFIFLLKYLFPKSVYIIRGNHEFASMCSECGFRSEIQVLYTGTNIFELILEVFNELPLAAILQHNIFCVHGGLCPELKSVDQIKLIQKPLYHFHDQLIEGLVWSDPSPGVPNYMISTRNLGYLFGQKQVDSFLQNNSLKMIIRAHQCIQNGIDYLFGNQVATVFSASNYCGKKLNQSGALILTKSGEIQQQIFPHFEYLRRFMVHFNEPLLSNVLLSKILPNYIQVVKKKKVVCPIQPKMKLSQRNSFPNLFASPV
jgi:protein phosphatase